MFLGRRVDLMIQPYVDTLIFWGQVQYVDLFRGFDQAGVGQEPDDEGFLLDRRGRNFKQLIAIYMDAKEVFLRQSDGLCSHPCGCPNVTNMFVHTSLYVHEIEQAS